MGTWMKIQGEKNTLAGNQRHATLLPASQREHAGVQTRTMVTSLSAKTESNDDACDNDDDACTLSVHELSLFCAEEGVDDTIRIPSMINRIENHESLARPKASWALLARPKAPSSRSNVPNAERHSVINKKEKQEKKGNLVKGKLPIINRTSFNSVIDLNGLEASADPTVACKAESSTRSSPSPCQEAFCLLADGGLVAQTFATTARKSTSTLRTLRAMRHAFAGNTSAPFSDFARMAGGHGAAIINDFDQNTGFCVMLQAWLQVERFTLRR